MDEEQLTIYCYECGVVNEEATELYKLKDEALRDAERELQTKRAQIRRITASRKKQREADPHYTECMMVFDYWRLRIAPTAKEFDEKRWNAVHARIAGGHTVDHIKRAIDGVRLRPYIVDGKRSSQGEGTQKFADLELICRSEDHLNRFAAMAEVNDVINKRKADGLFDPEHVKAMQRALRPAYERLGELRAWTPEVIDELGLGLYEGRVVFFGYDAEGVLRGASKYQPNPAQRSERVPKMLGQGSRELFPRPEDFDTSTIWLVEGEPDAVAMRVIGMPAVAVPGISTWKSEWSARFRDFSTVWIAFDCDKHGREAAELRQGQIGSVTQARIVDIDPEATDGYDISNLLLDHGPDSAAAKLATAAGSGPGVVTPLHRPDEIYDHRSPWDRVIDALEVRDCNPKGPDGKMSARCPAHDDRVASLVATEGDDGRVLLHCHAGCEFTEIVQALGLEMKDVFKSEEKWG